MTAVRIDSSEWPATISVGPGYYGLRIDTDHGTVVEHVDARALTPEPRCASTDPGPRTPPETAPPDVRRAAAGGFVRAHAGARCEEAA